MLLKFDQEQKERLLVSQNLLSDREMLTATLKTELANLRKRLELQAQDNQTLQQQLEALQKSKGQIGEILSMQVAEWQVIALLLS